jgi:hypothetical protein
MQKKSNMRYARLGHACTGVANRFIVAVGSKLRGAEDSCEIYDIKSASWKELRKLNYPRYFHSLCSFNNNSVITFGGVEPSNSNVFV